MDIVKAAQNTIPFVEKSLRLPHYNHEYGRNHIEDMLNKIVSGEISGDKAHRWLGYAQAAVVFGGGASLEIMKQINKGEENVS